MFLVSGQMETNLKGVEFFEILDGYHFLLSIPPPHPQAHLKGIRLEQLSSTS